MVPKYCFGDLAYEHWKGENIILFSLIVKWPLSRPTLMNQSGHTNSKYSGREFAQENKTMDTKAKHTVDQGTLKSIKNYI